MENTLENKEKFFAQYWGQRILRYSFWREDVESRDCKFEEAVKNHYILLKPLSSITDEDAVEVAKIFNQHKIKAHYSDDSLKAYLIKEGKQFAFRCEHYVVIYQYLQSKGYALPFMGLSVEQLVEYGWVKLT